MLLKLPLAIFRKSTSWYLDQRKKKSNTKDSHQQPSAAHEVSVQPCSLNWLLTVCVLSADVCKWKKNHLVENGFLSVRFSQNSHLK